MANPTTADLRRAVAIAEKIDSLQSELNSILGGSGNGSVGVIGKKRGRKPGLKAVVAAMAENAGESVKSGTTKKKRTMSPEAREKIAAAQRKRWAKAKKAAK